MDRSPHGSRLLAFQRAHGIPDSRAQVTRAPQTPSASPARHVVHGARQPKRRVDGSDHSWAFPWLIATGLLFWIASWLFDNPRPLPTDPAEPAAVEASR